MPDGVDTVTDRKRETVHWILHALLLVLLLLAVFPGVFLRGEVIGPGDLLHQIPPWDRYAPADFDGPQNPLMPDVITAFFPYYFMVASALHEGAWPLWNPYEFAGMPLLANCQSTVLYPPRLVYALFDVRVATTVFILMKLWLCGMTAFLCGRALKFSRGGATFFSIAWMLAGYNLVWNNWSLPDVGAWLPILFVGVEWILGGRYRRGFFALTAGGVLMLLAGHPETAFAMAFGLGIYFFVRLSLGLGGKARVSQCLLCCALGWSLALLVCAAQLLPFLEYLLNSSTLFDRPDEGQQFWYSPHAFLSLWVPRFFGTATDRNFYGDTYSNYYGMIYPGIAVWLGIFTLLRPTGLSSEERKRVIALSVAALVGIFQAFRVPPFQLLHELPVLNAMIDCYHMAFSVFALALLGALGFENWVRQPRRALNLALPVIATALVGGLVWAAYAFFRSLIALTGATDFVLTQMLVAGSLALLGLLVFGLYLIRPGKRFFALAIIALLALDLLYAGRRLNPTLPKQDLYPDTALTQYLQALPRPTRISAGEGNIPSGVLAPYGIEDWLAYDGLYPGRMKRFQQELGTEVWTSMEQVCGKEYYLHDPRFDPMFPLEEAGRYELVETLDGLEVYRNMRVLPRSFLAGSIAFEPDRERIFERMLSPAYDPGLQVLVHAEDTPGAAPKALREGSGRAPKAAEITNYTSTRVTIEAEADADSVLVLSDAWYPGWKATIDGDPVEVLPAYYVFRGVVVPPGRHTITFYYWPTSFYVGLILSVAGLALGSLAAYLTRTGRQRATASPALAPHGSPGNGE